MPISSRYRLTLPEFRLLLFQKVPLFCEEEKLFVKFFYVNISLALATQSICFAVSRLPIGPMVAGLEKGQRYGGSMHGSRNSGCSGHSFCVPVTSESVYCIIVIYVYCDQLVALPRVYDTPSVLLANCTKGNFRISTPTVQ